MFLLCCCAHQKILTQNLINIGGSICRRWPNVSKILINTDSHWSDNGDLYKLAFFKLTFHAVHLTNYPTYNLHFSLLSFIVCSFLFFFLFQLRIECSECHHNNILRVLLLFLWNEKKLHTPLSYLSSNLSVKWCMQVTTIEILWHYYTLIRVNRVIDWINHAVY